MKNKTILILTPSLRGGGWNCLYKFIKYITKNNNKIYIISAGKKDDRIKNKQVVQITLPYLDYDRYVHKLENNLILNILFNLPFLFISFLFGTIIAAKYKGETIIISNGLLSSLPIIWLKLLTRSIKIYSWIHTDIQLHKSKKIRSTIKLISEYINIFIANSEDVEKDLIKCGVNKQKIIIINNWITEYYKTDYSRQKFEKTYNYLKQYKFIVIYVGRFVDYKHFLLYLKVAKNLASNNIAFIFIGDGELLRDAQNIASENSHIFILGKKYGEELNYLYSIANITLTYADETYLSLTALESLSQGTPIIYPDISASPAKYIKKIKIKKNLVPKDIGFKIDTSVESISNLIRSLNEIGFPDTSIREKCIKYIKNNHSEENAKLLSKTINLM